MSEETIWAPEESVINPIKDDGKLNDAMPHEIQMFFREHQIEKEFQAVLKRFTNEAYTGRPRIVGEYHGTIPSKEGIAQVYGPGVYRIEFMYKPIHGKETTAKLEWILKGPQWEELHRKHNYERERERDEEMRRQAKEDAARNAYGAPNNSNGSGDAFAGFKAGIDAFSPLMAMIRPEQPNGENAMLAVMMKQMEVQSNQMIAMMQAQNNQMMAMVTLITQNKSGDDSGRDERMFDKAMGLMDKVVGLKNQLMPEEKGIVEKIVDSVAGNLELVMEMMSQPKEVQESSKLYKKATESKEFQKVKNNRTVLTEVVKHLDTKVGADTTDKLLKGFLKVKRPKETVSEYHDTDENMVDHGGSNVEDIAENADAEVVDGD